MRPLPTRAGIPAEALSLGVALTLASIQAPAGLAAAPGQVQPIPRPPSQSAPRSVPQSPPQFLPISARWCLDGPPPARCIQLEVPRGERQYAMGLQLRPRLPPLQGMWFPYTPPSVARFWMHRTPEPLDMLFVAGGRVIALERNVPPCPHLPCPSYGPDTPVEGVLELAAGQAAALGIAVGTPVRISPWPIATPSAPARD